MKKCPICNKRYEKIDDLHNHIEDVHSDLYPQDWSPARFLFLKKYGRSGGKCIVCGKETKWNDATNKPNRICSDRCRKIYREQFKANMIKTYGKEHLLNDPDVQKKMLANRKISGTYRWSSGQMKQYVGSYEKDLLQMLDAFLDFDADDVIVPAPQIFHYNYNGNDCFYIPDVYIESLNLIIEVKDGGDNPNTHYKIQEVDKEKEKLKDEVMKKQTQFNYIKISDKKYAAFLEYLIELKNKDDIKNEKFRPLVMLNEHLELLCEGLEENIDEKEADRCEDILAECYQANLNETLNFLNSINL